MTFGHVFLFIFSLAFVVYASNSLLTSYKVSLKEKAITRAKEADEELTRLRRSALNRKRITNQVALLKWQSEFESVVSSVMGTLCTECTKLMGWGIKNHGSFCEGYIVVRRSTVKGQPWVDYVECECPLCRGKK